MVPYLGNPDRQAPAEAAHDGGHRLAIGWRRKAGAFFFGGGTRDMEMLKEIHNDL